MTNSDIKIMTGPRGKGGWLILVGIGIVISIFFNVKGFFSLIAVCRTDEWILLTTPGTESYRFLWKPTLISEEIFQGGYTLAWFYTGFLFFINNRRFKNWFISMYVFGITFSILSFSLYQYLLQSYPNYEFSPSNFTDELLNMRNMIINAIIWIPYVIHSERVKATFVED